jgi:hypothetical protein
MRGEGQEGKGAAAPREESGALSLAHFRWIAMERPCAATSQKVRQGSQASTCLRLK